MALAAVFNLLIPENMSFFKLSAYSLRPILCGFLGETLACRTAMKRHAVQCISASVLKADLAQIFCV